MAAGRPPDAGESRDHYLRVRLAAFEAEHLDRVREGQSRSEYVRRLIMADFEERGLLL
jgi:hypothetical protein